MTLSHDDRERIKAGLRLIFAAALLAMVMWMLWGCSTTKALKEAAPVYYRQNGGTVSLIEAITPGPHFGKLGQPKLEAVEGELVRPEEARQAWESERENQKRVASEHSWAIFRKISPALIVPGALVMAASFLPIASALRGPGGALLGIGCVMAVIPWTLSHFGPALLWPVTIICAACLALGIGVVGYRMIFGRGLDRRIDDIKQQLEVAKAEGDKDEVQRHIGALIALERANDPRYEKRREWVPLLEANGVSDHE